MHVRRSVEPLNAEVRLDGSVRQSEPNPYPNPHRRDRRLYGVSAMAANSIMKRLWNDRRGTVAFALLIAMVPLLGIFSLGTEAGAWYVTRRHAQHAADVAAMAGGTALVVKD